jgi:hypothetical protein
MKTFKDAIIEGLSPSIGPVTDPITGRQTTVADLNERERKAREVAESLPPRQLRIVRLAYEQMLAEMLFDLTHAKCTVTVNRLPDDIRTGKQSVAEAERELKGWLDEITDCWLDDMEAQEFSECD